MDAVWDLEFTERKPLDDAIEEELTASGDKAFRNLYQCLLVHAADQQQSTNKDGASQVKLICLSVLRKMIQRLFTVLYRQSSMVYSVKLKSCIFYCSIANFLKHPVSFTLYLRCLDDGKKIILICVYKCIFYNF